jgi:integrase
VTQQRAVAEAIAQWEDDEPLSWMMSEVIGKGSERRTRTEKMRLTELRGAYSESFLLALKDVIINERHRVSLKSVESMCQHIRLALSKVHAHGFTNKPQCRIDIHLLGGIAQIEERLGTMELIHLKALFKHHRTNQDLFASDLVESDFPVKKTKLGCRGDAVHRVLVKAMGRGQLVRILDVVEQAYEEQRLNLARYAFFRLAVNVYARPISYMNLRCKDLHISPSGDTGTSRYFVDLQLPKTKAAVPPRTRVEVRAETGMLLQMHRVEVIRRYEADALRRQGGVIGDSEALTRGGPHAQESLSWGDMALFPTASGEDAGGADENWGGYTNSQFFTQAYLTPIRRLAKERLDSQQDKELTFTGLRHTVATQLALTGANAPVIAAALKHSSSQSAQYYVDLFFDGMLDRLNESMTPSFEQNYPAFDVLRSKLEPIAADKRIVTEDFELGAHETTGECGRTVQCSYAPVACYACPKFIPCYDADHSLNLDVVQREISAAAGGGLAMQAEVEKYRHISNCIRVVMEICDLRRMEVERGDDQAGPQPKGEGH